MPAPTRAVWLWFQLAADPEGFVPADLAGIALQAHVSLDEARTAVDLLESADPDADPEDPTHGVVVLKVPRGWQVIGFTDTRERARVEGQKARNRNYMRRVRAERAEQTPPGSTPSPQPALVQTTASPQPAEVDAPKPKPKPTPPKTEEIPPTPQSGLPTTTHTLDGWEPSPALRDEARVAGVTDFDERIAKLRTGPIGGNRGVIASELDNYIRSFFGTWRTWAETDRAKATQRALSAPSRGFGSQPATLVPTEALTAYAAKHGLDIGAHLRRLHEAGAFEALGMRGAMEELGKSLVKAARAKASKGAAA
jgi:hypothetical protein